MLQLRMEIQTNDDASADVESARLTAIKVLETMLNEIKYNDSNEYKTLRDTNGNKIGFCSYYLDL